MPKIHFQIRCGPNAETFILTTKPDEESREFPTIADALQHAQQHAQQLAPNGDARLTVLNSSGAIIIESLG